jgi:hypothetical protein
MVMEGVVLRRPADMFHNIFSCTQRWLLRLKPGDQEDQVRWVAQMRCWVDDLESRLKDDTPEDNFL